MSTTIEIAKKILHAVQLERSVGTLWAYNRNTCGFEPCHRLNKANEQRFMAEIEEWENHKDIAMESLSDKIADLLIKYPIYESNPAYEEALNQPSVDTLCATKGSDKGINIHNM